MYWYFFCVLPRKTGPNLPYVMSTQLSLVQLNSSRWSGRKLRSHLIPLFLLYLTFSLWTKAIGSAFKINPKSDPCVPFQPPQLGPPLSLAWPTAVASALVSVSTLITQHSSHRDIRASHAPNQNPLTQSKSGDDLPWSPNDLALITSLQPPASLGLLECARPAQALSTECFLCLEHSCW